MNLSAQDHQTFFTCECDAGKAEYELMQTAWRERNPVVRIKTARDGTSREYKNIEFVCLLTLISPFFFEFSSFCFPFQFSIKN